MERFDARKALADTRLRSFNRTALALLHGRGTSSDAHMFATAQVRSGAWRDTPNIPDLLRLATDRVAAERYVKEIDPLIIAQGDTGYGEWGDAAAEFVALVRADTILGKLMRARRGAFVRGVVGQVVAASADWVAQAASKPVMRSVFAGLPPLQPLKIAAQVVVTAEAIKITNGGAEANVGGDLRDATVVAMDGTFASADAAIDGERPAGIANGAQTISSTGSTAAQVATDLRGMVKALGANVSLRSAVWILSPAAFAFFSLLKIADPSGTLASFPVIVSEAATGVMLLASEYVVLAGADAVVLDTSRQASIEMGDGTSAQTVGLWQQDLLSLRAELFCNWQLAGPADSSGENLVCIALSGASYA